ncbi:MAG: hypothetical protein P8O79_08400 [Halieaceae bacterium]|nr:hypothetical protein [Halieaceae bacterium]
MKRKPDVLVVLAVCFVLGAVVSVVGPLFSEKTEARNAETLLQAGVYSE